MSVTLASLTTEVLGLVGDPGRTYWNIPDEPEKAVRRALRYVQEMAVPDLFANIVQQKTGLGYGTENLQLPLGMWKLISFRSLESDGSYSLPWTQLGTLDELREYSYGDTVNRLTSTRRRMFVQSLSLSTHSDVHQMVTYPILLTTDMYKMEWIPYLDSTATMYLNAALEDAVVMRAASRLLLKGGRDVPLSQEYSATVRRDLIEINNAFRFTTGIEGNTVVQD